MKRVIFIQKLAGAIAMLLLSAISLSAQNAVTVSGVITDELGPLTGVAVIQQGTSNGASTDADGRYTISVPAGAILEVSSIGYKTITVPAPQTSGQLDLVMEVDSQLLEETVVVGYGTVRKRNFTGSVASVKVSDGGVSLTAPTTAFDMLRGLTPGLTMSQSGVAGSTPSIMIRGQKSISGGSAPLIVLNGVIFKGTINDIDPASIEEMSVLKDATSLAAYGSLAANGVIMITSKKGERGKPMINFRSSVSLVTPNFHPDIMDGYEYIDRYNAVKGYAKGDTSWMSELEKANYEKGEQTDWFDYATRLGVRQNYSINVSGANDKFNYSAGASHLDNQNFIVGNRFKRETINARLNTNITNHIKFGLDFNFSTYANDGVRPSVGRMYSPWGEPYLEDGETLRKYVVGSGDRDQTNPLWSVEMGRDMEVRNNTLHLGGNLEITLPWIKGLSYKITGTYTIGQNRTRSFTHELNLVQESDGSDYSSTVTDKYLNQASGYVTNTRTDSWVLDNILSYTREFGNHWVSASLVYTRDSDKVDGMNVQGSDFADLGNTTLGFYGLNNAKVQKVTNVNYSLHNNIGYLARANYSYADKYHFNASVRRDGSSVFGRERKWGIFPAVGVAWTASNERFWQENIPWATDFKVKLSWGKNGNQSLSPYGTLSTVALGLGSGNTYYLGGLPYFSQGLATLGNPDLGWETTTSWNYGLETDLFKQRLHFEIDAYNSKTTDQIFSRDILSMGTGISKQSSTMGQVNNWGIEASLRANIVRKKDFNWSSTLQFTMNRNTLVELYGDGKDDITNNLFLGKSLGAIYGYKWIGVVQEDDVEYMQANGSIPGDPMYANLDGSEDNKIGPDDRTILGYNKEAFRMSWANTFTWKNWSLYFLFNGTFSGGEYGLAQNNFAYGCQDGSMDYLNANDHPYWTPENKSEEYLRPGFDVANGSFIALQKYGFVRLQDLNLSYNLTGKWLRKIGVQNAQLYLSGNNLFVFAPGWEFSDPEVRSSRGMQLARTYSFGINLRF